MKVKHFTHSDLDAVGCGVLSKKAYGENVDIEYCDYNDIDNRIMEFIASGKCATYDMVLITDISVDKNTAKYLNILSGNHPSTNGKYFDVVLLDHHSTAKWLNKYNWATVKVEHDNGYGKASGTSLLTVYFMQNNILDPMDDKDILDFTEKVRRWDCWEWKTKYNDNEAKKLNDLLYLLGREKFIERFINDCSVKFTDTEELILDIRQKEIDVYIDSKDKQLASKIYKNEHGSVEFGVVFAERFHSELGNELAKRHPEFDFIAMINPAYKTISYRGVKDGIDLGMFAREFGGGGHAKASGSPISEYIITNMIDIIWDTD